MARVWIKPALPLDVTWRWVLVCVGAGVIAIPWLLFAFHSVHEFVPGVIDSYVRAGSLVLAVLPAGAGLMLLWRAAWPNVPSKFLRVPWAIASGVVLLTMIAAPILAAWLVNQRAVMTGWGVELLSPAAVLLAVGTFYAVLPSWHVVRARRARNGFLIQVVALMGWAVAAMGVAVAWALLAPRMGGPLHGGWRGPVMLDSVERALPFALIMQASLCTIAACVVGRAAARSLGYRRDDDALARRETHSVRCGDCGYSLTASPGLCPECGQ